MCTEAHHIRFCIVWIPGMAFMFIWLKQSILWEPCIGKFPCLKLSHGHRHLLDICSTDGTVQDFIIQKAKVYYLIGGIGCLDIVWVYGAFRTCWWCSHLFSLLCGNATSSIALRKREWPTVPEALSIPRSQSWQIHRSRDHSPHRSRDHSPDRLGVCGDLVLTFPGHLCAHVAAVL